MLAQTSSFEYLKNKWAKKHARLQKKIVVKHNIPLAWLEKSVKQFMVGSVASAVMFAHPLMPATIAEAFQPPRAHDIKIPTKTINQLVSELFTILPSTVQPLTEMQEGQIARVLSDYFNIQVTAELNGIRLNRSYGIIGKEQHLMRYPGDTLATHFENEADAVHKSAGMAPGRGAWGYFAESKETLSHADELREKYYIAVQTFLSPGWNENVQKYYAFFKYRKMLVVNPENGKAIVTAIADAGPAAHTGKHLGGSPEVMNYLERQDGAAKGPVLYFFIDDPGDKVVLGPRTIAL